jgi:WD40 repeat protein
MRIIIIALCFLIIPGLGCSFTSSKPTAPSEMGGTDQKKVIEDETFNYSNNLAFVQNARSLVVTSKKYRTIIDKAKDKSETDKFEYPIRILSAENGKLEDIMHFPAQEEPWSIAGRPNGTTMVVVFRKSTEKSSYTSIRCYSFSEKRWTWRDDWPGKFDACRKVQFTPDGLKVIVIGYKHILFYDAETGRKLEVIDEPLRDYPLLSMSVRGTVLSPSGRYVVVWQELAPPGHHVTGKWIANRSVTVWDLQVRKQIAKWSKPEYETLCAAFTQDEKHILFGSSRITIWSVEKQEMIRDLHLGHAGFVPDMRFSSDYRYLALIVAGKEFVVRVYDYVKEREVQSFGDVAAPTRADSYPMTFLNGSGFFAFAKSKEVCVYDTQTWKEQWCSSPLSIP